MSETERATLREGGPVQVGLLITAAEDFRAASYPLFAEGLVDCVEWNLDMGWSGRGVPGWITALLDAYGAAGRLHGHGVEFSLLSARLSDRQRRWLEHFAREMKTRPYQRVSEHFGFITAGAFVNGTVMPHPRTDAAVALGRDRLALLSELAGAPVGLENLALAFGAEDVRVQPDFIDALLDPLGGHLLLDLHNLLCQADNFGVAPEALLMRYPLHRVRELHLAGGEMSYPKSDPLGRPFRRDSHLGHLPDGVFSLLRAALTHCPSLETIFFERADDTLRGRDDLLRFERDFRTVRAIVGEIRGNVPQADA